MERERDRERKRERERRDREKEIANPLSFSVFFLCVL